MSNQSRRGLANIAIILTLVIIAGLGGYFAWNKATPPIPPPTSQQSNVPQGPPTFQPVPQPTANFNPETAKVGDRFGIWTVSKNTVHTEEAVVDGKKLHGKSGQVSFSGSMDISGAYYFNDMDGGIILTPNYEYLAKLPGNTGQNTQISFYDFQGKKLGDKGRITLLMKDLVAQWHFCPIACGGITPFSATVSEVISDVSNIETFENNLYTNSSYGFQFRLPAEYSGWNLKYEGEERHFISTITSPDLEIISRIGKDEEDPSAMEWKQGAEISIYSSSSSSAKNIQELQELYNLGRGGPTRVNQRIVKVGGEDALIYDFAQYNDFDASADSEKGYAGHNLVLLHDNVQINVGITYHGINGQRIFDTILSTFVFLR